jgi:hypothetical protein
MPQKQGFLLMFVFGYFILLVLLAFVTGGTGSRAVPAVGRADASSAVSVYSFWSKSRHQESTCV